ncbi:MAG: LysE family translocator [Muribaculaceae bacterium]|nr:LysE family translocator [Muribaculaceae bacterium]
MEELLYMILRGLVIGVVVSAPMGPVGIYCIQRTLDKGRWSGFYTGVGAAISDLIYCLLTGFGMSFIEEFIGRHRSPIQFMGSLVLVFFGIWLVRKKPDGSIALDPDHGAPSREGDILKGFALTFSNPLILFLIIGLFAQFNFVIEGIKFYHYLLGFMGIIAGALGWWWLVSYFVDKLRGHFNQRTMKLINVVVGIIILIFAAFGIISSSVSMLSAAEKIPSSHFDSMSATFRVADLSMKGWHADFSEEDGNILRLEVSPVSKADPFGDSKIDALSIAVYALPSGEVLSQTVVSDGIDPYKGKNAWRVTRVGDLWSVFAGNREYRHMLTFNSPIAKSPEIEIMPIGRGDISVSEFDVSQSSPEKDILTEEAMLSKLNSSGNAGLKLSGIYFLYDYEQDDSFAVIGGSYRLAVEPAEEAGFFDLYYMDGAKANSSLWRFGMKKGRMCPTPFANIFDVEWRDSEGAWMLNDVQAEYDPLLHTLTVKFPYQNTSMRFKKVP